MRRVFLFVIAAALVLNGCVAKAQTEEERLLKAVLTGEIIRLHVVAAGDDTESQRIKLCVRDEVLSAWRDALGRQENVEDMMAFLNENRAALETAAREAARAEGFTGEVSAQVGVFSFPDRWYGAVLVPAGEYKALRIVLGEGQGHNWWCVLFPCLCLSLAGEEPGTPPEAGQGEDFSFSWRLMKVFGFWPMEMAV